MEHYNLNNSTNLFLDPLYTSLTQELSLKSLNTTSMALTAVGTTTAQLNPQNIDQMVAMEMKRIQENIARKEQQYVEQMLVENPITFERRNNVTVLRKTSDSSLSEEQQRLQQQRADACRRSRYNNKVKKAKSKYRHKFISQRLLQSTQMLNCIQDLIAEAESHLLAQGLNKAKLHQLRSSYGMDMARSLVDDVNKLDYPMKTEP
ncbi:protein sisterless A-like [Musca vetustissima]|uniref:protein sisterless A-like n=1 Tax=Musca vetustissima TaxID=27455 RepID=UPI002AB76BCA|nr:protein sisterless A-like [Musca vetustissima]